MTKVFTVAWIAFFLLNCKNEDDELSGDKPVKPESFLKAFAALQAPLVIADTGLQRFGDTTVISYPVLAQFIPDSVLTNKLGMQAKTYKIHPAGSIHDNDKNYLLLKFSSGKKNKLFVFVLNDKYEYQAALELLNDQDIDKYNNSVSVTTEPTFIIRRESTGKNNELLYTRHGFAFSNASHEFNEVMNDSNEDQKTKEVINPIDTLPATNKFSGNYISDERNFISVRDGKDAITYSFFIHFEKSNGECTGELKGEMSLTDEKNAVYQESGDPCVIRFKFSGTKVNVKEEGNCGNHRGITCPFDFTFSKKKVK